MASAGIRCSDVDCVRSQLRQLAQCADRAAYQTTDHRYDLLTGRKPNVRFRRHLVVSVVQMANVGSPPRPRHCPLALLMAAMRSTSVDGVQVHGTHTPLSHADQLECTRSDDWCVAFINGSGSA